MRRSLLRRCFAVSAWPRARLSSTAQRILLRMQTSEATVLSDAPSVDPAARPPVIRNAMFLVIAQAVVTPISVVVNAVAARHLGPTDFGRMYLATTLAAFALLFVEWGQMGALTGKVAVDRTRAGELLGSGLTWRLCA